jgi:hypothetical protein
VNATDYQFSNSQHNITVNITETFNFETNLEPIFVQKQFVVKISEPPATLEYVTVYNADTDEFEQVLQNSTGSNFDFSGDEDFEPYNLTIESITASGLVTCKINREIDILKTLVYIIPGSDESDLFNLDI